MFQWIIDDVTKQIHHFPAQIQKDHSKVSWVSIYNILKVFGSFDMKVEELLTYLVERLQP